MADLPLHKVTETSSTITLGWTPPLDAEGYRFSREKSGGKYSHTWDGDRSEAKFSKDSAWYMVEALGLEAAGSYPSTTPQPPDAAKLKWAPPADFGSGVSVVDFILRNGNRQDSVLYNGDGRDLLVHNPEVITGQIMEFRGWRNIKWVGGEIQRGDTSSGNIIPRNVTGTFHLEGVKIVVNVDGDAICPRELVNVFQIQNCFVQVTDPDASYHSDGFQTQVCRINSLRFDKCTFVTNYQGVFIQNEVGADWGYPNLDCEVKEMRMSRTNFKPNGRHPLGSYLFKGFPGNLRNEPPGPWYLDEVYLPTGGIPYVYPPTSFRNGYPNQEAYMKWGGFERSDAQGKFFAFSTPADKVPYGNYAGQSCNDCQVTGVLREKDVPDFAATAGVGYVSPGYA